MGARHEDTVVREDCRTCLKGVVARGETGFTKYQNGEQNYQSNIFHRQIYLTEYVDQRVHIIAALQIIHHVALERD